MSSGDFIVEQETSREQRRKSIEMAELTREENLKNSANSNVLVDITANGADKVDENSKQKKGRSDSHKSEEEEKLLSEQANSAPVMNGVSSVTDVSIV